MIKCSLTLGIDLIVKATHGRNGPRRWAYGSVTEKVLHGCKRSMLIVRPPVPAFSVDHR
jgi:nucleotide-binding universal stress UspA family protein